MSPQSDANALAKAAYELLHRGDAVGAERVLAPVIGSLKSDPAVQHLMGLIMKAQNRWEEAERCFRAAIALSLTKGEYYNDLGIVLQKRGALGEAVRVFRAALVLIPTNNGPVYVNLVRCLTEMNDLEGAEREARAYVSVQPSAESWTLLCGVERAQQRFEHALASAEEALRYAPTARGLLHNRAIILDHLGLAKDALEGFESLARDGLDTPELAVNFARALHLEGRAAEAEGVLEQAVGHWRANPRVHSALVRMRWLRGAGEESTQFIEAAMAERPEDLTLRLVCADLLNRCELKEKAVVVLQEGLRLAPGSAPYLTSLGVVYDEMGRIEEALPLLREAMARGGHNINVRKNLVGTLLRAGAPDEALVMTRAIRRETPDDQQMVAYEATALRMLGDPRYRDLYDYERLVRTYDIAAPRGYFNMENFNAALAEDLRALHSATAHPLDQSLRNGSQTGRSLLQVEAPNIKEFLAALEAPIGDYVGRLGVKPGHVMDARKGAGWRVHSCWSVRLRPGGHHVNHVHGAGWISSAYYVEVPEGIETSPERAGWLKFGEPNLPTPGCAPDHWIKPRAGMLVLFPSYMWHGTTPLGEGAERLTMAFDVVPT